MEAPIGEAAVRRPAPTPGDAVATCLLGAARRCKMRQRHPWPPADPASLANLAVQLDGDFCRTVADAYDQAPARALDDVLARRYERAKAEIRRQFEEVSTAGVVVEPWTAPGQPYRDGRELARRVRATGTLRIFLTRDGHGPAGDAGPHPLREPSGITSCGVELWHNDLARAVHDLFGHVMFETGFGPAGELRAAYHHMALSSEPTRSVLFTEQVAQICWFYFGPHLRDRHGRLRRPGDDGYVPPRHRPYPEQKVFAADPAQVAGFLGQFRMEAA